MAGIGIGASPFLKRQTSGSAFGPYTTAFQATVVSRGGSLTANELTYLTTFENSVGSDLEEFDRLWIHGLSNEIAARTSFVNPNSTIITAVNSPTFIPSVGYQGNGTTSYLNTNFNTKTQSLKFNFRNCSMGVYINQVDTIGGSLIGQIDSLNSNALYRFSPDSYAYLNYAGGAGSVKTDNGIGLIAAYKDNLTQQFYVKNGFVNLPNTCTGSLNNIDDNLGIFCRYYLGLGISPFSNSKISLSFVSSGALNQTIFYNSVQTLGTSIGWAV
jgi:hypothetical protein